MKIAGSGERCLGAWIKISELDGRGCQACGGESIVVEWGEVISG